MMIGWHLITRKRAESKKWKILTTLQDLKRVEQNHKYIWGEKELLPRTTNEVITNTMSTTLKSSKRTDLIGATIDVDVLGISVKLIREFPMWYRREASELNPF